jgi:hypothetical protein
MNPHSADWRYDRLKWLQGCTFRFLEYHAPSKEWDHDHCAGCWAKFADFDGPDILRKGFVYAEPYEVGPEPGFITQLMEEGMRCIPQSAVDGFELHWICPQCFEDFRVLLRLSLKP